jgi:hypothetical protein
MRAETKQKKQRQLKGASTSEVSNSPWFLKHSVENVVLTEIDCANNHERDADLLFRQLVRHHMAGRMLEVIAELCPLSPLYGREKKPEMWVSPPPIDNEIALIVFGKDHTGQYRVDGTVGCCPDVFRERQVYKDENCFFKAYDKKGSDREKHHQSNSCFYSALSEQVKWSFTDFVRTGHQFSTMTIVLIFFVSGKPQVRWAYARVCCWPKPTYNYKEYSGRRGGRK